MVREMVGDKSALLPHKSAYKTGTPQQRYDSVTLRECHVAPRLLPEPLFLKVVRLGLTRLATPHISDFSPTFSLSRDGKWKTHLGISNSQSRSDRARSSAGEEVTVRFPKPQALLRQKIHGRSIFAVSIHAAVDITHLPRGFILAVIILTAALQPICGYRK
jgi:hypothetical protein